MVDSGTFKTGSYLQSTPYPQGSGGVLLSNTDKSGLKFADSVRRSIDPSQDLSKLDVCFGGFSPTAMGDDLERLKERTIAVEQRALALQQAKERAAAVEAARASEVRDHSEGGASFKYVVLDDSEVRIERCETDASDLVIPSEIEGKPVVALATESFLNLTSVESIKVPDSVVSIGFCAFRDCYALRSIDFPAELAKFDSGWLRGCQKIERLGLPGKLEKITSAIFDVPNVKTLVIGDAASTLMPGAFQKSQLERVEVSEANPFISTDGQALYTKDFSAMLALTTPLSKYEVAPGCVAIAKKAFNSFECVEEVVLPSTVEIISDFAFTRTSIRQFFAPASLRSIGERAFYACRELRTVVLNDGLEFVGKNAFTDTSISELRIPTSILEIDNPVAEGTPLTYSGPKATFSIGSEMLDPSELPEGQHLILDQAGALYRNSEDGLHLAQMLEPNAETYEVLEGTIEIEEGAFAKHPSIVEVILPDSLKRIGNGAFKDARKLSIVKMAPTLESIGEEAFLDTNLTELFIPATLTHIGEIALITEGAHHGTVEPALRRITVDPANPKFRMESGLLLETIRDNTDRVVLCTGEVPDIVVPQSVKVIASYAFNGVRRIRTLSISEKVIAVNIRGLAFDCMLEKIHVDLMEPLGDRTFFEFEFPDTPRAAQQMGHAFSSLNAVSAEDIFNHYDNSIVNRSSFDIRSDGAQLSAYEQGSRIVARLLDPVFMMVTNRGLMESALRTHLLEICVDVAKHDDKDVIEGLLDLGFIDEDNIDEIIDAVGAIQDASVTNYLLDQKRRRFGSAAIDFSL